MMEFGAKERAGDGRREKGTGERGIINSCYSLEMNSYEDLSSV